MQQSYSPYINQDRPPLSNNILYGIIVILIIIIIYIYLQNKNDKDTLTLIASQLKLQTNNPNDIINALNQLFMAYQQNNSDS
jgi:hypothetical protein